MRVPFITIKIAPAKVEGQLSIKMKGANFDEQPNYGDLPPDQQLLWATALRMLDAGTTLPQEIKDAADSLGL